MNWITGGGNVRDKKDEEAAKEKSVFIWEISSIFPSEHFNDNFIVVFPQNDK